MKRWGVRATFLSSYTKLNAWQKTRITTETLIAATLC